MDDQKIIDAVMSVLIQPEILALSQDDQDDLVAAILSVVVNFYRDVTGRKTTMNEIFHKLHTVLLSQYVTEAATSATRVNYVGNA